MKKIILIIIAVLMLVTPMACSSQESESSVNNASNSEQGEIRIAWVNPTIGHPLYNMQDEGALLAAKEYGVTVDILGTSSGDPAEYVAQIEIAITEEYDGIILVPYTPTAMISAIQKAKEAGIPVVNTICDTGENPELRMSLLGLNLMEFGALEAESIAEKTDNKGKVCFAQTRFDNPIQNEIQEGFKSRLKEYPDMELVVVDEITIDTMTATEKFQYILTGYEEINASVINDATGDTVAAKVAKELGRTVDILSIDDVPETLDLIRDGQIWGTIAQNYIGMGYESVRIIVDYLNGEEVPDFVEVPLQLVTKDNLDSYKDELLEKTHKKGTSWDG